MNPIMFQSWLQDFVSRMAKEGIVDEHSLKGCSADEIDSIESEFQVRLPAPYRQVLIRFGKAAWELIDTKEMDFYYPSIVELNRRVRQGRVAVEVPKDVFAVRGRYDEQIEFVADAPDREPGPVWYIGDDKTPVPFYPSIEKWLEVLFSDALPGARYRMRMR